MVNMFPRTAPMLRIVSALLVGIVVLGFALGFVWFRMTLPLAGQGIVVERAPAIVVFTGSQARIPSALALWRKGVAQGVAPRLLVSGVYRRVERSDLVGKEEGGDIALGRAARNTFENAVETVLWTDKNAIAKIILVTSDVHMRRSRLYLRCLAPHLEIVPFAVSSRHQRLWRDDLKEYAKYLLAVAHCSVAVLPESFPTPQATIRTDLRRNTDEQAGKQS